MKGWHWAGAAVLVALVAPAVWFFGLRTSELSVQSRRHLYVLEVPRLYFLRDRRVEPIETDRGTVDMATLVAAPVGTSPDGYALMYVELAAVEMETLSPEEMLADAVRGGAEATGGTFEPLAPVELGGRRGLETRFEGRVANVPLRGRIRGFYVDGEVVAVMAICSEPACEDDRERLRVLDGFVIR